MHFFAKNHFKRENYKNSLNLDTILKKTKKFAESNDDTSYNSNYFYENTDEYVVIWYGEKVISNSNADDTIVFVDVFLANLTNPTYKYRDSDRYGDSYIRIQIPINYLHKMQIGSIWKDGESKERFALPVFDITVTSNNYHIHSIDAANTTQSMNKKGKWNKETKKYEPYDGEVHLTPFNYDGYFDKINDEDKNQFINILDKEQKYALHPLLLFIAHYGYSMDIKRIISRYSNKEIENRLILKDDSIDKIAKENGYEKYVILPKEFTLRDAVFLYHYKYNEEVKNAVNKIHSKIQRNKTDRNEVIRVDFWHKPTKLKVRGIQIGDVILCASIAGISEPTTETINVFLQPKKKVDFTSDTDREFSVITPYTPPRNVEELDFTIDPVNSIIQGILMEKLERIGTLVDINKVKTEVLINPVGNDTTFIQYPEINAVSVGDKQGSVGDTGLANCLFEVEDDDEDLKTGRFDMIWKHAKSYAKEINGIVEWYTMKQGFCKDDDFYVMSLSKSELGNDAYGINFPKNVLVIRITKEIKTKLGTEIETYFILEFGEDIKNGKLSGYNGIAYKQSKNKNFIQDHLKDLLTRIVSLNGSISYDFVDSYRGNIAFFKHYTGANNNWVRNGIKNLK